MIYLIVCEKTNSCKIGYSSTPKYRLVQLQTGNPFTLKLVSIIEGEVIKEKELHVLFKNFKLSGEWFIYHQNICEYFNTQPQYSNYIIKTRYPKNIFVRDLEIKSKLLSYIIKNYDKHIFGINKTLKTLISERIECTVKEFDKSLVLLINDNSLTKNNKLIQVNC